MHDLTAIGTTFDPEVNERISRHAAEYSAGMAGSGPVNRFSHVKPGDRAYKHSGLRRFFDYADLGVRHATGGRLIVQLVRASEAPEQGTGWHKHKLGFHVIFMVKGWARFMYEGKPTHVGEGDCVNMPPGITHYLYDYSPDMEFLEMAMTGGGDIPEEQVQPFGETPKPTPWQ